MSELSEHEAAAIDAVHRYIAGFNARDAGAMADAFNFPHIRLAKGAFSILETREAFVAGQAAVSQRLVDEGWDHTVTESVSVVHAGDEKVHLSLEYTRRHGDGSVYSRFNTLWIATLLDGHWGIQFRSSYLTSDASTFAPFTPGATR